MASPTTDAVLLRQLLGESLKDLFGTVDDVMLDALLDRIDWIEAASGTIIVNEGEQTDDLYCVISGRLRAYSGTGEQRRFLSEMGRGETIGEVAFFTRAARSATVIAVRDTLLVRMTRRNLEDILQCFPRMLMNMARLIADRLTRANSRHRVLRRPVNICMWPITGLPEGTSLDTLSCRLAQEVPANETAIILTSSKAATLIDLPEAQAQSVEYGRRLTRALDELEARHAQVIYLPDADLDSEWSRRCARMADRLLLLADASQSPELSTSELRYLTGESRITNAEQTLLLLHDEAVANPSGTALWLDLRPRASHLHIRPKRREDFARLARTLSERAVGLVFGDGGARCFAQLGAYKAMQEAGIEVDYVGGSSFGAVMAALIALDRPADELIAHASEAFSVSPTGDITLLPMLSLIKGGNLRDVFSLLFDGLTGPDADLADTWKTFYCIAGNYSQARETVLTRGHLVRSLRASSAAPGLLPPVPMNGELMVDGATFNGFPVDVMMKLGAGSIYGVALARDLSPKCTVEELPGGWKLLGDKLTGRRQEFHLPSLMQLMLNSATLYSGSRLAQSRDLCDNFVEVSLRGVGLLDWHKRAYAIDAGYKRMCEHLQTAAPGAA